MHPLAASAADFPARHPWLALENRGSILETQPEISTTSQPPLSGCETAQRYLHEINENLSRVQPCHGQRFTVADACSIWPCSPHLHSLTIQIHHRVCAGLWMKFVRGVILQSFVCSRTYFQIHLGGVKEVWAVTVSLKWVIPLCLSCFGFWGIPGWRGSSGPLSWANMDMVTATGTTNLHENQAVPPTFSPPLHYQHDPPHPSAQGCDPA